MIDFIVGAIAMAVVFRYGCMGEILVEKGGSLNLGIPGIMALGALGGACGVNLFFTIFNSAEGLGFLLVLFGIVFAAIFAAIGGLIFGFLTVTLHANQNVTGLVLTTFGVGFMKLIGSLLNQNYLVKGSKFFKALFVGYDKLGWFGKTFLSYGCMVYLAIIIAILLSIILKKTRIGLFLRSVGESPATADAQGINVSKYRYLSIIIGCAIAGLGGLYYVMDRTGGTTFIEADIEGFGWLAVALVIFAMWNPLLGMVGSFVFGALYILPVTLDVPNDQIKLFSLLPYIVTIIVLIFTSIFNKKLSQPPKALGINYFREDR